MHQDLETAALEKLKEKTNVGRVYLEQLYTFGALERDPRARVITVAYYALVNAEHFELKPSAAVSEVAWHDVKSLPALGFDHNEIISTAYERLRNKLGYTTVGFQLLPECFTLAELRQVYEIILQRTIDKRNFRKKIAFLDVLEETGETTQAFSKKPAKLYRFKRSKEAIALDTKNPFDAKIPNSLKGKKSS